MRKRRDNIAVADMVADMAADMAADMEVDKVANMAANKKTKKRSWCMRENEVDVWTKRS